MRVAEHPAGHQVTSGHAPASFIWRDRVYVVREVLGYWRERRAWWAATAARAVHGDVASEVEAADAGAAGTAGMAGTGTDGATPLRVAIDHEREVWRVEARGPRTVGAGVYDISREATQVPGEPGPTWRLLVVAD